MNAVKRARVKHFLQLRVGLQTEIAALDVEIAKLMEGEDDSGLVTGPGRELALYTLVDTKQEKDLDQE